MLPLLAVSLISCLVGMSGEGWAKTCLQNCGISSSSPVFTQQFRPWCHVRFVKNKRLECEMKVSLGYYYVFYRYHMYKSYQNLQYLEFPHPAVSCGISVGEKFLSLDVTAVFLMQTEKLIYRNIVISNRKLSRSNTNSDQGAIRNKIWRLLSDLKQQ